MHEIVVGVDGSESSVEALRFAVDEARAHNSHVKVVKTWNVPPLAYGADGPSRSIPLTSRKSPKPSSTRPSKAPKWRLPGSQ